jgi:murein DD-endopeptidase MepM/ murein hydrolase activator NlpD
VVFSPRSNALNAELSWRSRAFVNLNPAVILIAFATVMPWIRARDCVKKRLCPQTRSAVPKQDTCRFLVWVLTLSLLFAGHILGEDPAGKSSGSRETLIRISTEKEGTLTHLFVENIQAAEVTVTFEMDLTNLTSNVGFPFTSTVPGRKRVKVFTLSPTEPTRGWSWTYTYYSTFGSTTAEHDDSYVYSLPYAAGKSFRVSQGYNGEYSHFGADQFALDWRMPLGTPVHAARGGTVVGVKNDSNIGGDDNKYDWDANYVLIQHADGTLGQYVHLLKGGSKLKIGQHVETGDFIGLSGNTGHSTGPHLHFSVFKARDGKHRVTIPVRYKTTDDFAVTLEEGRSYKAVGSASTLAASSPKLRPVETPMAGETKEVDRPSFHSGIAVGH